MKTKLRASLFTIALISSTSAIAVPTQWGNTGHWYELISTPATAMDAFSLAQTATFNGMKGYLVTITSAGENQFVSNDIAGGSTVWLGGSDAGAAVNHFTWRNGPEVGQAFTYTNWAPGEPNNSPGSIIGEDYVYANFVGNGDWNDDGAPVRPDISIGYVVEYGDTVLTPIPEPQTYLMLLAGLGLLGFTVHRRKP